MSQLALLRRRPHVALIPITVVAVGALTTRPSFIPMTSLLALMHAYIRVLARQSSHLYMYALALSGVLAFATSVAHVSTAQDALSSATASFLSLFALSCVASLVAVSAILADVSLSRQSQIHDSEFIVFPAIWVTAWQAIAHISPLGWLTTWSPVIGAEAYTWMRPIFGSWGIMWVVAAWAKAFGMFIVEATDGQPVRRRSAIALIAVLVALTVPSYFDRSYPLPSALSPSSTPVTVACALPRLLPGQTALDAYVKETQKLVKDAKIILWPEGAVRFENMKDREAAIERLRNFSGASHDSYIGMTFEQPLTLDDGDLHVRHKIQNGLVLVGGKDGAVFEYYKRNLVPCPSV